VTRGTMLTAVSTASAIADNPALFMMKSFVDARRNGSSPCKQNSNSQTIDVTPESGICL